MPFKILSFFVFFLLPFSLFASTGEEDLCFEILTKSVSDIYGKNLKKAQNENGTELNLSTYSSFRNNRVRKPDNSPFFFARRNNIGTVIATSNYIQSQFSSFWSVTNFTFPINSDADLGFLGDNYEHFKNNLVYTHHLAHNGTFLSCGYLNLIPKWSNTLQNLDPNNYLTNTLDDSWFEIYDRVTKNGKQFLIGKVRISALDRHGRPLFRINLVTVAYDNKSTYFNEYETFPMQVTAMTNPDSYKTVSTVQSDFYNRIYNQTCLELIHPTISTLPSVCSNQYKSLSLYQKEDKEYFSLVPSAFAQLSEDEIRKDIVPAKWIMFNPGWPYELDRKVQTIPSENMIKFIRMAVSSDYDAYLLAKKQSWDILNNFESTFLNCNISYKERVHLISRWIEWLDIKQFDISNIEYPDTRIWDCIIPFPDKRNKDKKIPWSFNYSDLFIGTVFVNTPIIETWSSEFDKFIGMSLRDLLSERLKSSESYAKALQSIQNDVTQGKISQVQADKLLLEIKKKYENIISYINQRITELQKERWMVWFDTIGGISNAYIFWIICILLGTGILIFVIFLRKKPQSDITQ